MLLAAHGVQTPSHPIPAPRGRRVLFGSRAVRGPLSRSSSARAAVGVGFSVLEGRHLFALHAATQPRPGEHIRDDRPGSFSALRPRRHGALIQRRAALPRAPAARAVRLCVSARNGAVGNAAHGHRGRGRDGRDAGERPGALCGRIAAHACVGSTHALGGRQPVGKQGPGERRHRGCNRSRDSRERPALPVGVEPPAGQPAKQANVHGARPVCTNGGNPHDEHPNAGCLESVTVGRDRHFFEPGGGRLTGALNQRKARLTARKDWHLGPHTGPARTRAHKGVRAGTRALGVNRCNANLRRCRGDRRERPPLLSRPPGRIDAQGRVVVRIDAKVCRSADAM
jgi:hypothetical protein